MLSRAHDIIMYCDVGAPDHGKDVMDTLNDTDKSYLSMLTTTVKLPNDTTDNFQMVIHKSTEKADISLAN